MKIGMCVFSVIFCVTVGARGAERVVATPASADDYLRAIRANDLKALKDLSRSGVAEVKDRLDWSPLHYAAVYGSAEAVRILLSAGGNPNARNKSEATPLIYAAYNLEKTRLMVEKGGDVNAMSSDGTNALWVALGAHGNEATVRYLIEKGATAKSARTGGSDNLIRAAADANPQTVRLFLDKGLDPHHASDRGITALFSSMKCDGGAKARVLLEAGADVNTANKDAGSVKNGPIALTQLTPLMLAGVCGQPETISLLLKAGAKVNAVDGRHMSPLMMAVASDQADVESVRRLLAAGADVEIADQNGETALDWARKFRNPEIVALLEKSGAPARGLPDAPAKPADYKPGATMAVERASGLLAKSSEVFFREGGGCVGCHHQPFSARAFAAMKSAGLPAEPQLRQILLDGLVAERARELNRLPLMTAGGGSYDGFLYALAGTADMGEPASALSDVMVHFIAANQDPSGGWILTSARPPLEQSNITRTMLAVSALKTYGWPARQAEFQERLGRARSWLLTAAAFTTVEEADRLMGLWLTGAAETELRKVAQKLMKEQRADGGWAQTRTMESDAYGTAATLYSLRKTAMLAVSDAAYQHGAHYLLETQFPDGSWYVRSRAVKLQPYFQSAFPFDHDQWISNSATAYAVMALAPVAVGRP